MRRPRHDRTATAPDRDAQRPSESEQLLSGGPLRYDTGWSQHEEAYLALNLLWP